MVRVSWRKRKSLFRYRMAIHIQTQYRAAAACDKQCFLQIVIAEDMNCFQGYR
jgi:hypothetical protein